LIDIKLNSDNDIDILNGVVSLNNEDENVFQELNIRLQFFSGEWFLDIFAGIPYVEQILVKNPDIEQIKAIFVKEILDTDLVDEIVYLYLDFDSENRSLRIDFSVRANGNTIEKTVEIGV